MDTISRVIVSIFCMLLKCYSNIYIVNICKSETIRNQFMDYLEIKLVIPYKMKY